MARDAGTARGGLVVLAAAASLPVLGATSLSVALPNLAAATGTSPAVVVWVVTTFTAVQALVQPIAGSLADRAGHGRTLRAGLAVLAGGCLLALLSPTFGSLLAARCVQAVGVALLVPAVHARLAGGASGAGRRFAALTTAGNLAACLGPAIGSVLVLRFGWRAVFAATLMLATVVLAATRGADVQCGARRPPQRRVREAAGAGLARALTSPRCRSAVGLNALDSLVLTSLFVTLPFLLAGDQAVSAGAALATVTLAGAVSAPFGGRLADRVGAHVAIRAGFAVAGGGLLALWWAVGAADGTTTLLALGAIGAGLGLEFPATQAAPLAAVAASDRAGAAGVAATARHLGAFGGTLLVSVLLPLAPAAPLLAAVGATAVAVTVDAAPGPHPRQEVSMRRRAADSIAAGDKPRTG